MNSKLSFWEIDHLLQYDVIIIGSGIVGLSTAAQLLEQQANLRILILEKGSLPTGASTKNAGFACTGSLTELLHDIDLMGSENAITYFKQRIEGLKILRQRLGDFAIDYKCLGSYEILKHTELAALEKISNINKLLQPITSCNTFSIANNKIAEFNFNADWAAALVTNQCDGQIHTGKMMDSLLQYVNKLGARIITGITVNNFERISPQKIEVTTNNTTGGELNFICKQLFICTNAFTKKLVPHINMQPGRGQVVVTKPLPHLPFKGIFHYDNGYYYFRNYGNRVLLGGGRNQDFDTETTTDLQLNPSIQNHLVAHLQQYILPNTPFQIEHQWSGIMAFSPDKQPIFEQINNNIILGVALNGMGVAIGSYLGKQMAQLYLAKQE